MEVVWKGNPRFEPLLVPVETIQTHPRNPRRGDLPKLAESLDGFGQTRPIVVMPWNEETLALAPDYFKDSPHPEWIVAGNHTYRAAVEILAWTHIAVSRPTLQMEEYERYLLMDNRASDASEYDEDALIPILERYRDNGDFAYTGWDSARADDFITSSDTVSREAEIEFQSGYGAEDGPGDRDSGRLFKRSGKTANQLMLAYNNDAYQDVVRGIGVLRREYGTDGIGPTVARALAEQFDRVFHGG